MASSNEGPYEWEETLRPAEHAERAAELLAQSDVTFGKLEEAGRIGWHESVNVLLQQATVRALLAIDGRLAMIVRRQTP